ncbi:MAG: transketolase [Phycisphaerae bacterium]
MTPTPAPIAALSIETLKALGMQLRIDSIRCTTAAGSGHPTSSMSAADLMAVLLVEHLRYDWNKPHDPNNDRLIFSKGHACPLLYSMYKAAGVISDAELLRLRKIDSMLQGHPNPHVLKWVDVATGSLGQGIANAVGMALNGKYVDKLPYRVWVLLGDSELAEGSVWEAFDKASYYKLNNIIAIIDMNRLGQRGETDLGWNSATYAARVRAFGWHAIEFNGHDIPAIRAAYKEALTQTDRPTCLIAKTEKGHGVSFLANKDNWHGKALSAEEENKALAELGAPTNQVYNVAKPENKKPARDGVALPLKLPTYILGSKEAARKAYGDAIAAIGMHDLDVIVLDAEVSNSTYADEFKKAHPHRFFEMFISEQLMVSAATGFGVLGKKAFASTFAAFLTRAYDQIRMGAISNATIRLIGSHAGVSIGADGPSQMALEDIAMMRAVFGSTVLYPCDANQTAKLTALMCRQSGISYLRTTREKLPVIYGPEEEFKIGGSRVVRQSLQDKLSIVAAGITVHEAMKACDVLAREGIHARLIDLYSVKPVDVQALHQAADEAGNKIIVAEDHWIAGGLGDAVLEAFAQSRASHPTVVKLAVQRMPGSGTPAELMAAAGIDAAAIIAAAKKLA